jgi:acetyl esterase/lipase
LVPAGRRVEQHRLPAGARVRVFGPESIDGPGPALLWIHGGGYVIGTAAQDDRLCQRFADALGIKVVSVDYRLAPDFPYPAAADDCYAALEWLASRPDVDPSKIAVGGASAGGGLAAGLAIRAHDRGEISPIFQLLVYPMIDDRSDTVDKNHRLWDAKSNRFGWDSYLSGQSPDQIVPARRENLGGLAPAWIGVGTLDLFLDEDKTYTERLQQAGVPCSISLIPGAFHGFDLVAPKAGVSRDFFEQQCTALRSALADQ